MHVMPLEKHVIHPVARLSFMHNIIIYVVPLARIYEVPTQFNI